ncbi:hypothetical protein [Bacillus thuringiensis]|nr:hypothetical protein [Bacillus thuringiensis]
MKKKILIFSVMLTLMIMPFVSNKGLEEKGLDKYVNYMDVRPGG